MVLRLRWLAAAVALMLVLAGCGNNTNNQAGTNVNDNTNSGNQAAVESSNGNETTDTEMTVYPITVKDHTNTEIILNEEPKKIVTLIPSETESVFAVGAGDRLVGVNNFSDYPPEAAEITQVGDYTINIEMVTALEPDLILAGQSMNSDAIEALRQLGHTVYVSDLTTYDQVAEHMEQLGYMLNEQATASEVANHLREVKQEVQQKIAGKDKVSVYLEFSPGWTVGSGEYLDELVSIAGGLNVANEQTGWYEVDGEAIVKANPQVMIYPDFGEEQSSILAAIQARPGWEVIDAVSQNRIVEVDNNTLVRVGPRLAEGLLQVAKAIHPELFN